MTVAVVDTGVDRGSTDLAPNLLPGRNTYDGNDDTSDVAGHGTVIASVIAAPAGNGGYVGIAPEAKLLPVKVMGGSSGQDWSDGAVVRGIEYALAEGQGHQPLDRRPQYADRRDREGARRRAACRERSS